jgi:hypothetical protein
MLACPAGANILTSLVRSSSSDNHLELISSQPQTSTLFPWGRRSGVLTPLHTASRAHFHSTFQCPFFLSVTVEQLVCIGSVSSFAVLDIELRALPMPGKRPAPRCGN